VRWDDRSTTVVSPKVCFVVRRRCPLRCFVGLNWPFRLEFLLPRQLPSRILGAWSLPSEQDILARRLSRQPTSASCTRTPFHGGTPTMRSRSRSGVSTARSAFPCGGVSPLRHGRQRLQFGGGGSFSPACRPDASSSFGQGRCSAHDQQCSPSFVRVNARGFDFPCPLSRPRQQVQKG